MSQPTTRLSQCFEWGLNSKTLEYDEEKCIDILDAHGITNRQERDFFWMGYLEEPRVDGSLVSVNIGPSQDDNA